MHRATVFVTLMLDVPAHGENFTEAMEYVKKKRPLDYVKLKPGVESVDHQIQVYSVTDMTVNGEM